MPHHIAGKESVGVAIQRAMPCICLDTYGNEGVGEVYLLFQNDATVQRTENIKFNTFYEKHLQHLLENTITYSKWIEMDTWP